MYMLPCQLHVNRADLTQVFVNRLIQPVSVTTCQPVCDRRFFFLIRIACFINLRLESDLEILQVTEPR